jgi:putative hydrolase of the HAD superfamily
VSTAVERPVEAVLFDVGGVLMVPDPAVLRAAVAHLGICPADEVCRTAVRAAMVEMDRQALPPRLTDWDSVNRACATSLGVAEPDSVVIRAVAAAFREAPYVPVPKARSVLAELARRRFKLGIISNAHGTVEEQLAKQRICSLDGRGGTQVEVIIDSTLVGLDKPDPAIFQLALEALGVPARKALYVGDSIYCDVEGAIRAGLGAIHVSSYAPCGGNAHADITDIVDLLTMLD